MASIFLGFNWIALLLVALTWFFVANDHAFSKRVRIEFYCVFLLSTYLSIVSQHLSMNNITMGGFTEKFIFYNELIIRPVIMLLILSLFLRIRKDKADYIFICVQLIVIAIACVYEYIFKEVNAINSTIMVVICIYYYYCVMQTYKRDGLTRLLIRHNLNFEMADLINTVYDIVLIDVDNFKLINDKYGHDKGDEALVTVVKYVNAHLPKGCQLYRYGGDEFVIISKKVKSEELIAALEETNNDLSRENLRISFGIVRHEKGVDSAESLVEADKRMYENKRLLKSEDIWDDMTGLFNYRGFLDEIDTFKNAVFKENNKICLIAVDIDRLHNINMAYGYTEGNLVIKTLSRVLKTCLSGRDFIGHLGSDEFAVAVECKGDTTEVLATFTEKLQEALDSAYELASKDYSVKLNTGIIYIDEESDEKTSEELVNDVLYVKQEDKENRRKTDVNDLDQDYNDQDEKTVLDILNKNKLRYAFQPIVSAKDGEVIAYEALMRSDTEPMVSPLKILKYADRNKKSYEIEKLTFSNVLSHLESVKAFPEKARIFINSIPGCLLNDNDYAELKGKYGKWFERMVVEITEQREVDDNDLASINLRRDQDGFSLAIDDYGSGYSNTNSLLRYMPHIVKLDRLLITGIDRNAKKQFFVSSIISFARENDMKILAEGVETEHELKTLIRLGVDMIQGYFTAKPAFEIIESIPNDIKKIIIDENLKASSNQRMIYTASESCELSVMHLAMEDYSKLNISGEFVKLIGSSEYTADMVIKIKDGANTHLTLSDVRLNSVDDEPCIDIGEGASLTLNLEGSSSLNAKGIRVPEGSSLTVKGSGNLEIYAKGHECYAIGNDTESAFGNITLKSSGLLKLTVDGENCVDIGGGITGTNSEINLLSGKYEINVAGVSAVGVGYYKGNTKVNIKDAELFADFRVNEGIVIGSMHGDQNTEIQNFNLEIAGSGAKVAGIGNLSEGKGSVKLSSGSYKIKLNGQRLYLLGCENGELDIEISHVKLDMIGEGNNVLGFGSFDKASHLRTKECSVELVINASSPLGFGIVEDSYGFKGALATVNINGDLVSVGD